MHGLKIAILWFLIIKTCLYSKFSEDRQFWQRTRRDLKTLLHYQHAKKTLGFILRLPYPRRMQALCFYLTCHLVRVSGRQLQHEFPKSTTEIKSEGNTYLEL